MKGDLDTLNDVDDDADRVPPGPSTRLPLMKTRAPAEPVGGGDGVEERVDVAVDDALPVELLVDELVRVVLALGETMLVIVPCVPLNASESL
jgi:hypothetical protein